MAFTLTGRPLDHPHVQASITWDAGRLSGDDDLVAAALATARNLVELGVDVGPVCGPYTSRDHLASGISAITLLWDLFAESPLASGDVPHRPPIPEGAIS